MRCPPLRWQTWQLQRLLKTDLPQIAYIATGLGKMSLAKPPAKAKLQDRELVADHGGDA